jgi:uncharacterized membrane protein
MRIHAVMSVVFRASGRRILLASAMLLLAGVAMPGEARADLKLCNSTSSRIGIAIGYKDTTGWVTEGWWNVASHSCETLLKGNLIARYYYVHAVDYDRGGEWRGPAQLCTDDKAFTIQGVDDCTGRGFKQTGFFEVDTNEEQTWTVRLVDPAEGEAKSR